MAQSHGVLYYRHSQRACDFCIYALFDGLNILDMVIISVNKIICEDLMKITQIFVEIWTHLFLWIGLKMAKRYRHYYCFCVLGYVALNYHPTKFGSKCKRQCGYMDKTVRNCQLEARNLPPV